ncbi:MAG TPA: hypothetical protein PK275_10930 [Chitinophagaceae bacterium]|nr:hypothetical protein [Chitinophagaceae bacterium]
MNKFKFYFRFIFFSVLLMASQSLFAQDGSNVDIADSLPYINENTVVKEDTTESVIAAPPDEVDYNYYFTDKSYYHYDSPYLQRKVSPLSIKTMKEEDAFWYAKGVKQPTQKNINTNNNETVSWTEQRWFQTLLWLIIIGVFAAAVIWYLMSSGVRLFRKKDITAIAANEASLTTEDIFAINYNKELEKAELAGNYRLAIRLMFLRMLKIMAEKKIINYQQDKTNFDYLMQLQPTGYYNSFFKVTRSYEYSWYGQFDVQPATYQIVKNDFNQFNKMIH